ncbi:MAG: hypothetical protein H6617_09605 [Bdellovibrionaceae bacterium]|nr:hypothetical protein [Bdellovibrionales bacterium]MCB9254925.1 hypothetical protein [Pseudobdellovibrionaceae bacterium]
MSEKHKGANTPNVVDLAEFRRQRAQGRPTLFYISEGVEWLDLLESYRLFDVRHASSVPEMTRLFDSAYPDVVFVESWLSWATPVALIRQLAETFEVPIILSFREGADPESTRKQIKEAYAAGVSDALQCPLHREELKETLEVLLKLQTQFSLYH